MSLRRDCCRECCRVLQSAAECCKECCRDVLVLCECSVGLIWGLASVVPVSACAHVCHDAL
jgi:glycerol dehydrogenase-like iron-containing ADH family enzyme